MSLRWFFEFLLQSRYARWYEICILVQWVSGASDGSLAVWSQMKKRPVSIIKQAHAAPAADKSGGAASMDSDAAGWIQSVAACQGSDLVVGLRLY